MSDRTLQLVYPSNLPVSARHDEILAAIRDHQVVIVAGETGSGKTTQIPKMCLELGRGRDVTVNGKLRRRMIGHTQPRRIAARTIAERLAEETGTVLGDQIGYQVRFHETVSKQTRVKVMTDGILLAELRRDPKLWNYDTIIIDEAHERSLNIDFLLGCLTRILERRSDLKLIITSATIDVERFSQHFHHAPVIEVSGRTFPVDIRYEDPVESGMTTLEAIGSALDELMTEPRGDILVFQPTEADIRDALKAFSNRYRNATVLPLYGRLTSAEQHRIFETTSAAGMDRRIIFSTNVAETSLTVPGIRYVVDTGTARISRFSARGNVQRLPIEAVSQASANQRAGRCGRVADGICIRLYSLKDFLSRPEYTDPEILRTNLASVILQMGVMRLGSIEEFPFLQKPEAKAIKSGIDTLTELQAIVPEVRPVHLTAIGKRMAQLPIDPRYGRMLIEGERRDVVHDVAVIVAGLTVQDPRERPREHREAADQAHARFVDKKSDFMGMLNLWDHLVAEQEARSSSGFRRMCRQEYLSWMRTREWFSLVSQLMSAMRVRTGRGAASAAAHHDDDIHIAIMSGLLTQLGIQDVERHVYRGSRGTRFNIFPGSALAKHQPPEVMSAELVETSRLWARVNAAVKLSWAEPLAGDLVHHSYNEPHWSRKRQSVVALDTVTLFGLPIVDQRRVQFARINPGAAREIFIRSALVEGDWDTRHAFFHDNQRLRAHVQDLENRTRRRDLATDDETLFAFYDARIPTTVFDGRSFDAWWKTERRAHPDALTLTQDDVVDSEGTAADEQLYPSIWHQAGFALNLSYRFDPGSDSDGVNVDIPLPLLTQISPTGFDWLVPGMREELVTALIKGLPKQWRKQVVPATDFARRVLATLPSRPADEPITTTVAAILHTLAGVVIPAEAWRPSVLPAHLRMGFRVLDDSGSALAESTDLLALQHDFAEDSATVATSSHSDLEVTGATDWTFGALADQFDQPMYGSVVHVWPGLVDEGESVGVRLFTDHDERDRSHSTGLVRLLLLKVPWDAGFVLGHLTSPERLAFANTPFASVNAIVDDCVRAQLEQLVIERDAVHVHDRGAFEALQDAANAIIGAHLLDTVTLVAHILRAARGYDKAISSIRSPLMLPNAADMRAQLDGLIFRDFVSAAGLAHISQFPRYLDAGTRRAQAANPREHFRELQTAAAFVASSGVEVPGPRWFEGRLDGMLRHEHVRWMLEELRVSLFAQELGTQEPVSLERIKRELRQK